MVRNMSYCVGLILGLFAGSESAHAQELIRKYLPDPSNNLGASQGLFDLAPTQSESSRPNVDTPISPNTGMPRLSGERRTTLADLAADQDYVDPRYIINSQQPDRPGCWERVRDGYGETLHRVVRDYKRFYLSENLLYVGLAVGIAAPFANTELDQRARDGYQRVSAVGMNRTVDQVSEGFKQFGEYTYAVPTYFVLAGVRHLFPDVAMLQPVGEFGDRSLRALAVGAPMTGALQYGLGAGRPYGNDSHWHPFRAANAASGHAFVGAIPFLTAASMVDNRLLKAVLIAASFGTGWSRIHTDAHYTGQVILGWSMAVLAVEAVNFTEADSRYRITPIAIPNGFGVGMEVHY